MIKQVTIMLDDDLIKKLINEKAKIIQKTNSSISFSQVANDYLKEGLKKKKLSSS